MPSKGYRRTRNNVISEKFFNSIKKDSKLEIDYKTFQKIILESNSTIFDIVANEPTGFKLPEGLGYLVVTKYKSNKKPIDWKNTHKYKKVIYLTNLHSFGYISHIKWCKFSIARFKYNEIYKFEPCRYLTRKVSANTKAGVTYFNWQNSDFWSTSKLDRLYNRKYKTQE